MASNVRTFVQRAFALIAQTRAVQEPSASGVASDADQLQLSGTVSRGFIQFTTTFGILNNVDYILLLVLALQVYSLKAVAERVSRSQSGILSVCGPGITKSGTFGRKARNALTTKSEDSIALTLSGAASIASRYSASARPTYPMPSSLPDSESLGGRAMIIAIEKQKLNQAPPRQFWRGLARGRRGESSGGLGFRCPATFSKAESTWSSMSSYSIGSPPASIEEIKEDVKYQLEERRNEKQDERTVDRKAALETSPRDVRLEDTQPSGTSAHGLPGHVALALEAIQISDFQVPLTTKSFPKDLVSKIDLTAKTSSALSSASSSCSVSPKEASLVSPNLPVVAGSLSRKDSTRRAAREPLPPVSDNATFKNQVLLEPLVVEKLRKAEKQSAAPDWQAIALGGRADSRAMSVSRFGVEKVATPVCLQASSVDVHANAERKAVTFGKRQDSNPNWREIAMNAGVSVNLKETTPGKCSSTASSAECADRLASKRKQRAPDAPNWREQVMDEKAPPVPLCSVQVANHIESDVPNWREQVMDADTPASPIIITAVTKSIKSDAPKWRELATKSNTGAPTITVSGVQVAPVVKSNIPNWRKQTAKTEAPMMPTPLVETARPIKSDTPNWRELATKVDPPVISTASTELAELTGEGVLLPSKPLVLRERQSDGQESQDRRSHSLRDPMLKRLEFKASSASSSHKAKHGRVDDCLGVKMSQRFNKTGRFENSYARPIDFLSTEHFDKPQKANVFELSETSVEMEHPSKPERLRRDSPKRYKRSRKSGSRDPNTRHVEKKLPQDDLAGSSKLRAWP